jgi:hypothetical protein
VVGGKVAGCDGLDGLGDTWRHNAWHKQHSRAVTACTRGNEETKSDGEVLRAGKSDMQFALKGGAERKSATKPF